MVDHEGHRVKLKDLSGRLDHPFTYNDNGAPTSEYWHQLKTPLPTQAPRDKGVQYNRRQRHG